MDNPHKISKEKLLEMFLECYEVLQIYEKRNRVLEDELIRLHNTQSLNTHFREAILSEN